MGDGSSFDIFKLGLFLGNWTSYWAQERGNSINDQAAVSASPSSPPPYPVRPTVVTLSG